MINRNGKNKKSGGGNENDWQIVYSGFVLILLCFFIMLCSFSTMETSKVTRFVKSFSVAVSVFPGGLNFEKGEVILPLSADIISAKENIANIFSEISSIMKIYGVDEEVGLYSYQGELVIRLADSVLFDSGKAAVNTRALPLLEKIGGVISKTSYLIRIEGHTG
jgi:chemotaxis protein MotB